MNQSNLSVLLAQHAKLVHEIRMARLVEVRVWLLNNQHAKHVLALAEKLEKLMPMERHYGAQVDELFEEIESVV